jgi:hypothetical protein
VINVLLVYDRAAGRLLREEVFETRQDALRARFTTEKQYRGREGQVEVVALEAASREALLRTHGRYFMSLDELAEALDAVRIESAETAEALGVGRPSAEELPDASDATRDSADGGR